MSLNLCGNFYKPDVWAGNAPVAADVLMADGSCAERWTCRYGGGTIHQGKIINATFSINADISVWICGDQLQILRFMADWNQRHYTVNFQPPIGFHVHAMDREEAERILSRKFNCRFWELVQRRALGLLPLREGE